MNDIEALARTLYGEARGEGEKGMDAVACVVLNRKAVSDRPGGYWWGDSIEDICLKKWQFSCWNFNDPNRDKLMWVTPDDHSYGLALIIAQQACQGRLTDMTGGATHYCVKGLEPAWAHDEKPTATIGNHVFYRPKEVPQI